MKQIIFLDNTTSVKLLGLQADGQFINDATVALTLTDSAGDPVVGETWPAALQYVADSNGDYKGTVSHLVDVTKNKEYTALITAEAPDGSHAKWTTTVVPVERDDSGQALVNG